jgi:hypothetical protein
MPILWGEKRRKKGKKRREEEEERKLQPYQAVSGARAARRGTARDRRMGLRWHVPDLTAGNDTLRALRTGDARSQAELIMYLSRAQRAIGLSARHAAAS